MCIIIFMAKRTPVQVKKTATKRRGRPPIGAGSERINVTIERQLLDRTDKFAKSNGLTRAELIARGLNRMLS